MNDTNRVWLVGEDIPTNKQAYEYYRTQYRIYKNATNRVLLVSYGSSYIQTTHAREHFCALLCMKLSVSARSLYALIPDPDSELFLQSHLDFSSSATLARLLANTFASLYHFGIEECSEDEFEVRQLLAFWRDYRVRRKMNFGDTEAADRLHEPDLKKRLKENEFWLKLPAKNQRQILKQNLLLHSEEEILERAGFDRAFHKQIYAYWSAHTHCDSVAFLNMAEDRRGSGQINAADIGMLAVSLEWASKFLHCASEHVDRMFVGAEQRAAALPHLDLLANKVTGAPWAGLSLKDERAKLASVG